MNINENLKKYQIIVYNTRDNIIGVCQTMKHFMFTEHGKKSCEYFPYVFEHQEINDCKVFKLLNSVDYKQLRAEVSSTDNNKTIQVNNQLIEVDLLDVCKPKILLNKCGLEIDWYPGYFNHMYTDESGELRPGVADPKLLQYINSHTFKL